MLHWAVVLFVVALLASLLGLRGVGGLSAEIGYFFGAIAVVVVTVTLLSNTVTRITH